MQFRARTPVFLLLLLAPSALAEPVDGPADGSAPDRGASVGDGAPERGAEPDGGLLAALTSRTNYRFRSFTAYWDNDGTYPNIINDSDHYYTSGQGFEIGFDFEPDDPDRFAPGWENPRFGVGLSLKQHIYTASDIEVADPDPDDHPYAGWLTLGVSFQRSDAHRHDHFGLDVGVVGSWAYGEDIQKWIHDEWPDQIYPQGWHNQLANELAVNAVYQRTWRTERAEMGPLAMDLLPAVRFDAGNVFLRARGQATLRAGWNLPDDFGPASFQGINDHTGRGWSDPDNDWSVYAYATLAADAVGRNVFLDGNTFAPSRSTDREVLVARAVLGVFVRYRWFRLGWAQTFESETFEAQENSHTYGSIVFGYHGAF